MLMLVFVNPGRSAFFFSCSLMVVNLGVCKFFANCLVAISIGVLNELSYL